MFFNLTPVRHSVDRLSTFFNRFGSIFRLISCQTSKCVYFKEHRSFDFIYKEDVHGYATVEKSNLCWHERWSSAARKGFFSKGFDGLDLLRYAASENCHSIFLDNYVILDTHTDSPKMLGCIAICTYINTWFNCQDHPRPVHEGLAIRIAVLANIVHV